MDFVGLGKDIHKLKQTKTNIVLGGYSFASNHKIVAVSDGDIILHACADAILGACCAGDIGMYFPDTSSKNKNIDSKIILAYALAVAKKKGMIINNIDITVVCDKIMINPKRKQILNSLKLLLKTNNVNLKATRFEENKNIIEVLAIVSMKKGK